MVDKVGAPRAHWADSAQSLDELGVEERLRRRDDAARLLDQDEPEGQRVHTDFLGNRATYLAVHCLRSIGLPGVSGRSGRGVNGRRPAGRERAFVEGRRRQDPYRRANGRA